MTHNLKIEDIYLRQLLTGVKKCEVRRNDRHYGVGDELLFRREEADYYFRITHIETYAQVGNMVVLSVEKCAP